MIDRKCLAAYLRTCFKTGQVQLTSGRLDLECLWLAGKVAEYLENLYEMSEMEVKGADCEVLQGEGKEGVG